MEQTPCPAAGDLSDLQKSIVIAVYDTLASAQRTIHAYSDAECRSIHVDTPRAVGASPRMR